MVTKTTASGTTTMVYDSANRATSINGPDGNEANAWSPDGRRAQMVGGMYVPITGGSGVTNTSFPLRPIYDLTGNPIADTGNSGTRQVARYRVYGPGIDEPLAETRPRNEIDYLHHDALGSITCATDATGFVTFRNSYRAFGQRTFTDITKPAFFSHTRLSYTSRESSVGTMYQYRSRYYDSGVGRFGQQDSFHGSDVAPPSLNRYAYGYNSPVLYIDPMGHAPWIFQNLADLANVVTLPKPTVETIYWAALDFLAFFAALLATNPSGAAPLWLTIMGYAVLTIGIGIGLMEILLDSKLSIPSKTFLFGLWVSISFTMFCLGNGIFAMMLAMGGTAGLANAPTSAIIAGTLIGGLTSYMLWLIDQAFTAGLEVQPRIIVAAKEC